MLAYVGKAPHQERDLFRFLSRARPHHRLAPLGWWEHPATSTPSPSTGKQPKAGMATWALLLPTVLVQRGLCVMQPYRFCEEWGLTFTTGENWIHGKGRKCIIGCSCDSGKSQAGRRQEQWGRNYMTLDGQKEGPGHSGLLSGLDAVDKQVSRISRACYSTGQKTSILRLRQVAGENHLPAPRGILSPGTPPPGSAGGTRLWRSGTAPVYLPNFARGRMFSKCTAHCCLSRIHCKGFWKSPASFLC